MMKTFIKVINPLLKDNLLKAGFPYISIEAGNLYVYECTESLKNYLKQIDADKTFGKGQPAYAFDTRLQF